MSGAERPLSASDYPSSATPDVYLRSLRTTHDIHNITYGRIALSNPGACLYEGDPNQDFPFTLTHSLFLWPGGGPLTRKGLEIYGHGEAAATANPLRVSSELRKIQETILSASIAKAALEGLPQVVHDHWESLKQLAPVAEPPILKVIKFCMANSAPLGVCEVGTLSGRDAKVAEKNAILLWFPWIISPKPVLAHIKSAIKQLIRQETLSE